MTTPTLTPALVRALEELRADPLLNMDALHDGEHFIFDLAARGSVSVWGADDDVAWASGESLFVCGPPGVGKTTLVQQLALARSGVLPGDLLGLPVARDERRVLYIAADRPKQAGRSFARMVPDNDIARKALRDQLVVWSGPLPFDLASEERRFREFVEAIEPPVGTVFVDSLKDVALDLSKDETGSRVNLAFQTVLAAGIELAVVHHQRKAANGALSAHRLDDVFGSAWITAGAGSVFSVVGDPGDPVVTLKHLKQPVSDVGPLTLLHDHDRGRTTLYEPVDLWTLLHRAPPPGLTAKQAARGLFGATDPSRPEVEKARRKLDRLVKDGHASKGEPTAGGEAPYRPIDRRHA